MYQSDTYFYFVYQNDTYFESIKYASNYAYQSFCQTEKTNRKKRVILTRFAAFQQNQSFLYLRYSF